jgi:hypothetical protein
MKMIGYKGFEVAQTLLYLFIFAVLGVGVGKLFLIKAWWSIFESL